MPKAAGVIALFAGVVVLSAALVYTDARATAGSPVVATPAPATAQLSGGPVDTPAPDPVPTAPAAPLPAPTATPVVHPSFAALAATVQALLSAAGADGGVELIELGGKVPATWSLNAAAPFDAASDYKLVALMAQAQGIAAGTIDPNGPVCYEDADYEDGWFSDYAPGSCFTRSELAARAGLYSDNTAGHMLVRDLGGSEALNAFASRNGATGSDLFETNSTTAHDLAVLWAAEAGGRLGGATAQAWLYPLLTRSRYEAGIPAGLPNGQVAIHKTGELDLEVNDAALVTGGPAGPYVLVVLTNNAGDGGWSLIAQVSAAVARYEAAR